MDEHVVIVGGGFSGALLAINLMRHDGPRATLVERRADHLARGVAYAAADPDHLLNVRAANMSALPDDAGHFVGWLQACGLGDGGSFVSRVTYGRYLAELLDAAVARANGRLTIRHGDACDIAFAGEGAQLVFADGTRLAADRIVLAVGNLPPHTPRGIDPAALPPGLYRPDPWAGDVGEGLHAGARVVLVGTGLTAIDAALLLDKQGFAGEIVALSRRGLRPRAHRDGLPPARPMLEKPARALSDLVRLTREATAVEGWRAAVDALRPVTQLLWSGADDATRARFLRHLRPFWDVHRHRLAPAVAARIDALVAAGRLRFVAGKIARLARSGDAATLTWRPRGGAETVSLPVDRVVNCTGPEGDLLRSDEPLLRNLVAAGRIRPDALHLGIDVDAASCAVRADGKSDPRLLATGPMTRGQLWETVAVPDLRVQSWSLARHMSNAHWVAGEGL